jgi:hypothetical protein
MLWMLPWIFLPFAIAAWHALRAGRQAERSWFCLCLAAPIVITFTLIPLWGDRGLPHWQMPGWLMLFPVLGDYAVRAVSAARLRRKGVEATATVFALAALVVGHAATGYGLELFPYAFPHGDPTLESFEWSELPAELHKRGLLPRPGIFIITTSWAYAGKIDLAFKNAVPIVVVLTDPKQYGLRYDSKSFVGHDALLVGPVESMAGIDVALRPYFDSIQQALSVALGRDGRREIALDVYLAHDLKTPLRAPLWSAAPASAPLLRTAAAPGD